ncbi:NUDIX domain-containing protein [Sporosarcina sp. YIM B06819]|uniref:NUDIX domain-containing protein n=1 Tax=Sporosarcina sp. YIM B06819 TaxID=3081769 RepID=UPI00298CACF7|nr:NUDIX domain-containing protein [Sporosarcina sp. YIM B06819]
MFIINTEAAIYRDGKYLICKRSEKEEHAAGMLSLIGGKVEVEGFSTDILERTVVREVAEEVGVIINRRPRYVHSSSFVTDTGIHIVNINFLCEDVEGEPYAVSADEVEAVYWMTAKEVFAEVEAPDYLKESIGRAETLRTGAKISWRK